MTIVRTACREMRLGTRASKLALAQTALVREALVQASPGVCLAIKSITTKGDEVQDRPLSQVGGNGVFVRRIEEALLRGEIDVAVHSAKDLPASLAPGLTIAGALPRADARDVLVSRDGRALNELPDRARVGTSSPRRACQLRALRSDLTILDIRGNVDTRLRKLRECQYEAIVLAAAGLERLGLADQVTEWLDPDLMIPAVGQGVLAVEVRESDRAALELALLGNDEGARTALTAERAFLAAVGGSCTLPVAAHATLSGRVISMVGMIGAADGRLVKGQCSGRSEDPISIGAGLAQELLSRGGRGLVEESLRMEQG